MEIHSFSWNMLRRAGSSARAYSDAVWRIVWSDTCEEGKRLQEADLDVYRGEYRSWYDIIGNRIERKHQSWIPRLYKHLMNESHFVKYTIIVNGDVRFVNFSDTSFIRALRRFHPGRRLAITRGKCLVSVPWNAGVGDEIAVLYTRRLCYGSQSKSQRSSLVSRIRL
jgi:hypothetical protein